MMTSYSAPFNLLCTSVLALILLSCSPKIQQPLSGTSFVAKGSTADVAIFEGYGLAKKKELVLEDAVQRAFKALLVQGISDSPYGTALLPDQKMIARNQSKLDELLATGYRNFVRDAELATFPARVKKSEPYSAYARVYIDVRGLRRSLEQQGLRPRFGL